MVKFVPANLNSDILFSTPIPPGPDFREWIGGPAEMDIEEFEEEEPGSYFAKTND